jgi:hypothetical protein
MHLLSLKRRLAPQAATAAGLRAGEGGATVVEFALVAPIFLAILCAIMEFSGVMFVQALLEGAAREASRYGITGRAPEGICHINREEKIREIIADTGVGVIDLDRLQMETLVYDSFEDVGQPEPFTDENGNGAYEPGEPYSDINGNGEWDEDMGAAGLGGPGSVVVYRLHYDWRVMIPLFVPFFGETVPLQANIAVRNELFPGT